MDETPLEQMLKEPFSRKNFISISINLAPFKLNEEPANVAFSTKYKENIESFLVLGNYFFPNESKNVYLLEVKLKGKDIERAPIFQRKVVANFLEIVGGNAAIVAFYSDDSEEWKYSLVDIEYKVNKDGKITKKVIGAKRYSFIVGPNVPVHTATEQISTIFGKENTFQDVLTAFSIEKVSKDFFIKIASAFRKLVGGSEIINGREKDFGEGVLTLPVKDKKIKQEFGIRLINRLIFCWFLKKKKTDTGNSLISDAVLSSTSVKEYRKNFKNLAISGSYYHDVIEPLFFEIMNKPEEERIEKFKKIPALNEIPFLNGGLFEPHKESDFYEFDKNSQTLKIPDEWFEEFFETLERYNFTVDENTPVDIKLSINPEMLGIIFENLLAEINPETGETARKSTGSYYTPVEIVEFMVTEALKYYLIDKTHISEEKINDLLSYSNEETDFEKDEIAKIINALDSLKIIDPACGSGAFPIYILQKIVLILQKIDSDNKKWFEKFLAKIDNTLVREEIKKKFENEDFDYLRKLAILQHSIYGVDIQPMATEISRLRAFLTLIVDAKVKDNAKNKGIKPLPNLDFKFVTANSLIDIEKIELNKDANQLIKDPFFDNFKSLTQKYFAESDINKKRELRKEIEKLIDERINEKLKHIDQLSRIFDARFEVSKKKKEKMANLNFEATLWRSYKNIFKEKPVEFFNPKYFFPETEKGFDIVIANPPYVNIYKINHSLVKYLKKHYKSAYKKFDLYVIFIERGIQLSKIGGIITYIVPDKWISQPYGERLRNVILEECKIIKLIDLTSRKIFKSATVDNFIFLFIHDNNNPTNRILYATSLNTDNGVYLEQSKLHKNEPFLLNISNKEQKILEKINSQSIRIRDIFYVNWGCRPSPKQLYVSDKKENGLYKPLITGKNIKKYYIKQNSKWVKYISSMYNPMFSDLFEKTTIVMKDIIGKNNLSAALNDKKYYSDHTVINLLKWADFKISNSTHRTYPPNYIQYNSCDIKFVLGVVNSMLISFYFNKTMRNGLHTLPNNVKQLPIPIITPQNKLIVNQLISFVNQILAITQKEDYDPKADNEDNRKVKEYERQIDQLVYKLYNLTPEEIKIVEESAKQKGGKL